jgi:hypothetical protein
MATDEILEYRATSPLTEYIFRSTGDQSKISLDPELYVLESNPYFDTVQDIFDKFGKTTTSQFYTIEYNLKYNGDFIKTTGNNRCSHYLYVSPDNYRLIEINSESNKNFSDSRYNFDANWAFKNPDFLLSYIELGVTANASFVDYCLNSDQLKLDAQIEIRGKIFMKKYCEQNYIDNICTIFCSDDRNLNSCKDSNITYCFNNSSQPQFSRFFQTDKCKIFVKQYFAKNTSHPEYDKIFKQICKILEVDASNYKNYTNGTDPQLDLDIKNICACNLDDSIYNNFYNTFANEIPTIRAANFGSKKCIFPECNTSEYKPTEIIGYNVCPRIDCINVSQIDNDGRIIGGLTINQSNNCPNIQDPRRPCNQDGDCGIGKKCLQGVCVEENVCRVNTNCNPDTKCYNNICVRDDYCSKDSDCGEGLKCSKNVCVKNIVATNNITLIIFISLIALLLILFGIIIIIYLVKKSKRNK